MNGYMKDAAWLRFQTYLPKEGRFTGKTLPKEEEFSYGRFKVHTDRYIPLSFKGSIVMIHGLGLNGRYLSFLATRFLKEGYEVICPDLPFFGYTEYEGTVNYDDVTELIAYLADQQKDPVFLLGTGFGGTIAYDAATLSKKVRGILATSFPDPGDFATQVHFCGSEEAYRDAYDNMRRWQWLLPGKKCPLEDFTDGLRMTNNPDASKIPANDPKAGKAVLQMRFVYSVMQHVFRIPPAEYKGSPVFLGMPEKDEWFDPREQRGFFDRISTEKKECVLPGGGHLPIEPAATEAFVKEACAFIEEIRGN